MPTITISTFLSRAKDTLASVTDEPLLEAEILLSHLLKKSRSFLRAFPETTLTEGERQNAIGFITRRIKGEPIAYITEQREFWSLDLFVNSHTLIPRPDTETLVESALAIMKREGHQLVADLGTGSGAIGLSLAHECKHAQIFAVDISEDALDVARFNANELGITNITFHLGNWCLALPSHPKFDMIVSNPPYLTEAELSFSPLLSYEPRISLISGIDGLDAIRTISLMAKSYLKSGGYLMVEHGALQGLSVRMIFASHLYANIYTLKDLSGQERVTIAKYL